MNIKNIIWDWNGTIVDDAWVFVSVMNKLLYKQGLPQTNLKHYRKNFCFPIQDYWRGLGFKFTEDVFNKLNAKFIKQYEKKMFLPSLHMGLLDLFKTINEKKIQQFVLSASENSLLKQSIKHYGLQGFFKGVFGVDNLNAVGKESVGRELVSKYQLNLSHTLLIGDTEYDFRVAKKLGCSVLLVSYGHINHQRLLQTGVSVVSSVEQVAKHLSINQ